MKKETIKQIKSEIKFLESQEIESLVHDADIGRVKSWIKKMRHIFIENEEGVLACEACGYVYGEVKYQCCPMDSDKRWKQIRYMKDQH